MSDAYRPIPHRPPRLDVAETLRRLREDLQTAEGRRSVRHFSTDPVPREAIELALRVAGTAPSGAHRQPWFFVAISDPEVKARIREAAEREEREFYERRATPEWLEALAPLGTDFVKTHITDAPWLIVVFRRDHEVLPDGRKLKSYYLSESVGIAVGFLIQALHRAGLATLPHTPAPMTFLREICRPPGEREALRAPPGGVPEPRLRGADLARKPLPEIAEIR
ncbi:MAG: nitroreductase family protein [Sandaracinaceae bacterium]|nr:nitroreductase family protein [Sandaracinaceae bacterium]